MRGSATIMRRRLARVRVSANREWHRIAVLGWLALIIGVGAGVVFLGAASAAPLTFVDDGGADDEPGQKDLNSLTVDYGAPGAAQHQREVGLGRHGDDGQQHPRRVCPVRHRRRRVRELLVLRHRRCEWNIREGAVLVRRRRKRQLHEPAGTHRESSFDRGSDDRAQLGSVRGSGFTALHCDSSPQQRLRRKPRPKPGLQQRRRRRQRDDRVERGWRQRRVPVERLQLPVGDSRVGSVGLCLHPERRVPDHRQGRLPERRDRVHVQLVRGCDDRRDQLDDQREW